MKEREVGACGACGDEGGERAGQERAVISELKRGREIKKKLTRSPSVHRHAEKVHTGVVLGAPTRTAA